MCRTRSERFRAWQAPGLAPCVCLAALLLTGAAAPPGPDWFHDYDKGLAAARKGDKPVLLDFGAAWCVWCRKMDEEVYSDASVQAALKEFVCIKVDTDDDPRVAVAYQVQSLPRTLFLNTYGEITVDRTGYMPVEGFKEVIAEAKAAAHQRLGAHGAPEVKPIETPAAVVERALADASKGGEDALLTLLANPDEAVREAARQRVRAAGGEAVPMLVAGLSDPYLGTRIASIDLLKQLEKNAPPFDPWAGRAERNAAVAQWDRWLAEQLRAGFSEEELERAQAQALDAFRHREHKAVPQERHGGPPSDSTLDLGRGVTMRETDSDQDGQPDHATVRWPLRPGRALELELRLGASGPVVETSRVVYAPAAEPRAEAESAP